MLTATKHLLFNCINDHSTTSSTAQITSTSMSDSTTGNNSVQCKVSPRTKTPSPYPTTPSSRTSSNDRAKSSTFSLSSLHSGGRGHSSNSTTPDLSCTSSGSSSSNLWHKQRSQQQQGHMDPPSSPIFTPPDRANTVPMTSHDIQPSPGKRKSKLSALAAKLTRTSRSKSLPMIHNVDRGGASEITHRGRSPTRSPPTSRHQRHDVDHGLQENDEQASCNKVHVDCECEDQLTRMDTSTSSLDRCRRHRAVEAYSREKGCGTHIKFKGDKGFGGLMMKAARTRTGMHGGES